MIIELNVTGIITLKCLSNWFYKKKYYDQHQKFSLQRVGRKEQFENISSEHAGGYITAHPVVSQRLSLHLLPINIIPVFLVVPKLYKRFSQILVSGVSIGRRVSVAPSDSCQLSRSCVGQW